MKIYCINMARSQDRWAKMAARGTELGLEITRLEACDAGTEAGAKEIAGLATDGPIGPMGKGTLGCSASHARAWRQLIESGEDYALILEDDAALSDRLPEFIEAFTGGPDLLNIEYNDTPGLVLIGARRAAYSYGAFQAHRLYSLNMKSAGYVISRKGAQEALARFGAINVPIDHFLFNPTRSQSRLSLSVHTLTPCLLVQDEDTSEINAMGRGRGKTRAWRRGLYELRVGVYALGKLLSGQAKILQTKLDL